MHAAHAPPIFANDRDGGETDTLTVAAFGP